jgi:enoyl-CoA hydratase/carnithine racemase
VGSDSVLVKAEEGFTTITMNSPERRNTLSLGLLHDMTAAFRAAGGSDARGVILAANGPVFSAGHDFRDLAGADAESIRELLDTCTELMLTMQKIMGLNVSTYGSWDKTSSTITENISASTAPFGIRSW